VQQRSAGVECLLAAMQDPGDQVRLMSETDGRDADDGAAGDVARGTDALDGFAAR
jgi:hypothetical protein